MKEIRNSISNSLPPLRIYRDKIEELYSFLNDICEDSVDIQTCGYSLDSIDEITDLPQEQTNSISFTCNHPYLQVILTPVHGEIYCSNADIKAEGIVSRTQQILLKGKVTRPFLPEHKWLSFILGLAFGTPLGLGLLFNNVPVITFGGLLLLGWFVFVIWDYHFKRNSFCTIVFKSRKEAIGFWKRNKDQVVLLLIGAIIGTVITLLVGAIKSLILEKP